MPPRVPVQGPLQGELDIYARELNERLDRIMAVMHSMVPVDRDIEILVGRIQRLRQLRALMVEAALYSTANLGPSAQQLHKDLCDLALEVSTWLSGRPKILETWRWSLMIERAERASDNHEWQSILDMRTAMLEGISLAQRLYSLLAKAVACAPDDFPRTDIGHPPDLTDLIEDIEKQRAIAQASLADTTSMPVAVPADTSQGNRKVPPPTDALNSPMHPDLHRYVVDLLALHTHLNLLLDDLLRSTEGGSYVGSAAGRMTDVTENWQFLNGCIKDLESALAEGGQADVLSRVSNVLYQDAALGRMMRRAQASDAGPESAFDEGSAALSAGFAAVQSQLTTIRQLSAPEFTREYLEHGVYEEVLYDQSEVVRRLLTELYQAPGLLEWAPVAGLDATIVAVLRQPDNLALVEPLHHCLGALAESLATCLRECIAGTSLWLQDPAAHQGGRDAQVIAEVEALIQTSKYAAITMSELLDTLFEILREAPKSLQWVRPEAPPVQDVLAALQRILDASSHIIVEEIHSG